MTKVKMVKSKPEAIKNILTEGIKKMVSSIKYHDHLRMEMLMVVTFDNSEAIVCNVNETFTHLKPMEANERQAEPIPTQIQSKVKQPEKTTEPCLLNSRNQNLQNTVILKNEIFDNMQPNDVPVASTSTVSRAGPGRMGVPLQHDPFPILIHRVTVHNLGIPSSQHTKTVPKGHESGILHKKEEIVTENTLEENSRIVNEMAIVEVKEEEDQYSGGNDGDDDGEFSDTLSDTKNQPGSTEESYLTEPLLALPGPMVSFSSSLCERSCNKYMKGL